MKYLFSGILVLAILLLAITIGANNNQVISLNYVIAQSELRLSTLVAVLFGFGLILGWLITAFFYLKLRMRMVALEYRLKRQTQRIAELTEHEKKA